MPWRETSDPYRIWLSEVMLQQTRVDQALPYYLRFLEAFPTVHDLATADLDDVLRRWEGLGYYSRARNLYRAAQQIVTEHGGHVPNTYETISTLPGVGPYTAAAVLSIAYGRPHAVLDGNVIRVLARVFAVEEDVKRTPTLRRLQATADALLDVNAPGPFNEAIMELGATVCTPRSPDCPHCPLHDVCQARNAGMQERYPIAAKKKPGPHYDIAVGLIENERGEWLIQRRPDEAMLGGLWEFPGGKREPEETLETTCRRELLEELGVEVEVGALMHSVKHAFTHFRITLYAFRCTVVAGTPHSTSGLPLRWVTPGSLSNYAFPRANRRLIEFLRQRKHIPTLFDTDHT